MRFRTMALGGASAVILATIITLPTQSLAATPLLAAATAEAADTGPIATVGEVVVTAQKREENINNVGMSIQAASGDKLLQLGVHDTSDLQKIVPGFQSTPTYYGTYVFTIRGVGFQDTSLAGSPTVSVYLDEAPLPFSALTNGASLDLQRVEVLKGPQGTLFGENATGGAINYVANKPSDSFDAGVDASYGRFNDADISGFVSGPVANGLDVRLAGRINESGPWQNGYAQQQGQTFGGKDFINGRLSVQWKPTDKFKALLTLNSWLDRGWTQMGQLYGIAELSPLAPLAPAIANYPLAPHNDQAAGWNSCVNNSPFDPIANQQLGHVEANLNPTMAGAPAESMGPGSVVQAGGQPTSCEPARKHNTYFSAALRMDYELGAGMTVTSLTSVQRFSRHQGIDGAGMAIQDYQSIQHGKITSIYQELRLSGNFGGKGNWIIGGNYEHDSTWDQFLQTYNASTASPTLFAYNLNLDPPVDVGLPLGPTKPTDTQTTDTYAVFAHAEYPILPTVTLLGGVRYTREDKLGGVCGNDGGDGTWALVAYALQPFFGSTSPALSPAGSCASTGTAAMNFNSPPNGALFYANLNEDNVAWQAGLNWKPNPDTLLYVNVSQGYKGGSFPTVALATFTQTKPVVQEGLLSYEVGFKAGLLNHTLQANGAFFYYDYSNKQILGAVSDPLFGALPSLVNVPKSHVIGFELSGTYAPDWLPGLTITPAVSYQFSKIDTSSKNVCAPPPAQSDPTLPGYITCQAGHYYNFDAFNQYADYTGEAFPSAPKWQGSVDAQYQWTLKDDVKAFVGATLNFVSDTNTFFVNRSPIPAFYNAGTSGVYPIFGGYLTCAGAPSATAVGPCPTNHANDPLAVPGYALLDLRAGIVKGPLMVQVWGRNVTNKWYWTSASHVNDVLLHYTGQPVTYGVSVSYRFR
ncbi:MAG TPA: TonB-dependent receptor [Caulobacteraceae bacterium]|nr:TonB-dependent receptor [Caulobacteraceae bacterium]